MGLFSRKRGNDSSVSTLSEEEIQKKLYGEFKKDPSRVAGAGERDSASESSPVTPKTSGTDSVADLFSASKEPGKTARPDASAFSHETARPPEPAAKPVFIRPPEPKLKSPAVQPASDAYERYREPNRSVVKSEGKSQDAVGIWARAGSFFQGLLDSNRFFTRQILYWTAGVLVVFVLFWGVNALNVQREQAMKSKYRGSGEQEAATAASAPSIPQAKPAPTLLQAEKSAPAAISENPISKPAVPVVPAVKSPALSKPDVKTAAKRFVIQVVTYPSQDYAARIVASLNQAGFKASVKEQVRASGTTLYVVLIGGFQTAAEAQQQLSKFRANEISRPFSDAFVKTTE